MTDPEFTLTSWLNDISAEHPGVIASRVKLPEAEAVATLRVVLLETQGLSREDVINRIGERLRDLLGLTLDDTETVTRLTPDESDRFDAIAVLVNRAPASPGVSE